MQATTAKIIYAIGLFLLAAAAVIPQKRAPLLEAAIVSTPLSTENRLAVAMTERITLEAAGDLHNYRLTELEGEIDGLRRLAFEDDAEGARGELIDALADQLSLALARRSDLSREHAPALTQVDTVIRALTQAINAEVRSIAI